MNYREQLQKANELGLDILSLAIANEVDFQFSRQQLSSIEFEMACELVMESYLKSEELSIYSIIHALYNIIDRYDLDTTTIEEIIKNTNRQTLTEEACWY